MSGRAPWLLLPFVVAVYVGLLAPLVVVIAISFGPSPTFAFPPTGFTCTGSPSFSPATALSGRSSG